MWNLKKIGDINYAIRICEKNGYTFLITDFVHIWNANLSKDDLCNKSKSCNPILEASDERFIVESLRLFDANNDDVKWNVEIGECSLNLSLNSIFCGVPFNFKLHFQRMNSNKFFEEITNPLFVMLHELQRRQNILYDLVKKKDIEITEYKMEGAVPITDNSVTSIFNSSEFEKSQNLYLLNNGAKTVEPIFDDSMAALYKTVYEILRDREAIGKNANEDIEASEKKVMLSSKRKKRNQELLFDDCKESTTESASANETVKPINSISLKRKAKKMRLNI